LSPGRLLVRAKALAAFVRDAELVPESPVAGVLTAPISVAAGGSVTIRATRTSGVNAVLSDTFLGGG
jgi:hypothetical protein